MTSEGALAAYGQVLGFILGASVFAGALILLNRVLVARLRTRAEVVPVTSGVPPELHAWNRYHVRYYVYALLFLAFDMEMVFMYPWAVVFRTEGITAFLEMGMFIVILLLGVLYAWREGAFRWS